MEFFTPNELSRILKPHPCTVLTWRGRGNFQDPKLAHSE